MVSINEEVFLPIKDFDNYMVSNLGNVKNATTGRILKQRLKKGYKDICLIINGKKHSKSIHRLVANAFLENIENKPCVDHIDNDRQNNNINNLRFATRVENGRNRVIGKNNTSGAKGISYRKDMKKWEARITIDGIRMSLGCFNNIEDAKQARISAVKKVFGEFVNKCECETNQ